MFIVTAHLLKEPFEKHCSNLTAAIHEAIELIQNPALDDEIVEIQINSEQKIIIQMG